MRVAPRVLKAPENHLSHTWKVQTQIKYWRKGARLTVGCARLFMTASSLIRFWEGYRRGAPPTGWPHTTQPSRARLPGAGGKASPVRDAQHALYQEVIRSQLSDQ